MAEHTPLHVWLRVAGGGVSMPSGKSYTTMVGDDRELPRHTQYVRSDAHEANEAKIEALTFALKSISELADLCVQQDSTDVTDAAAILDACRTALQQAGESHE